MNGGAVVRWQAEMDGLRPKLPNVDDSALERLVVQLRTVQVRGARSRCTSSKASKTKCIWKSIRTHRKHSTEPPGQWYKTNRQFVMTPCKC